MPTPVIIKGSGDGQLAKVSSERALYVTQIPRPAAEIPASEVVQKKVLSELLKNSSGSSSLVVNGSSSAKDFLIAAQAGKICWVRSVVFTIHSTFMNLNNNEIRRFGAAATSPGLTNGVRLFARQGGAETDMFVSSVKNVGQFYRYADRVTGLTDGISAGVDLLSVKISFPEPVGLAPASDDAVVVRVQDDLTSLTLFDVQALGWCVNT